MADSFSINIFVPDGDPQGVRIIDRTNWTGRGVVFRRSDWPEVRKRSEMQRIGIYILVGDSNKKDGLPKLYIGQSDVVGNRINSHQNKNFWYWAAVFVSTGDGLNRAHVSWLEYALLKRVRDTKCCHLDNSNKPQEPALTEAEKAGTRGFLKEILQILPLVGLREFESRKQVATPRASKHPTRGQRSQQELDTIIVPAKKDGFETVFLGEDCWHAIRISEKRLDKIKFIAAYQTRPASAITHYAPVSHIESHGKDGKYKVVFSGKAKKIGPVPFGDARLGSMQGPRYTSFARLQNARKLTDVLD